MATSPSSPRLLQLTTEKAPEHLVVRGVGRITSESESDFRDAIRELIPQTKRLVLDLTKVDYIDSSGLGALVSLYTHASRSGCVLEIANPKQRIRDLFKMTKLSNVFESSGMDYFGM